MNNKKIKIFSAIGVLIVAIVVAIIAISSNSERIQSRFMYSLMPDSVSGTLGDDEVTFYKRKNKDYNPKTDKPAYEFQFYFTDENGNEVVVNGDDSFEYKGEEHETPFGEFMLQSLSKISSIKTCFNIVVTIFVILVIIAVIVIWFFSWSKRQDQEKEKKYHNKNNTKNKKSKK